jgi:hypothetical protein
MENCDFKKEFIMKNKKVEIENIADKFDKFLNTHRYKKGVHPYFTHTEMNTSKGAYYISDSEYSQFIKLYIEFIKEGYEIGLVERHDGYKVGPLICDFDFRSTINKRSYTQEHIKKIINLFVEVIQDLFHVNNEQLESYIYEKDIPTMDKKDKEIQYKDGFHIYFPYLPLSVEFRYLVYKIILNKLIKQKILDDIPTIEELSEVYDKSVIYSNGMMMLGSVKPGRTPYELTYIYKYNLEEIDINLFSFESKIDTSLLRIYDDDDSLQLKSHHKSLINECIRICNEKNYPTEFKRYYGDSNSKYDLDSDNEEDKDINKYDVNNINEKIEILKQEKKEIKEREKQIKKEKKEQIKELEIKDIFTGKSEIERFEQILKNLNNERFKKYDEWYRIGLICIRNNLYDVFDIYSKIKAPEKYNKQENYKIISSLYKKEQEDKPENIVTEKTLMKWLKIDNINIYNEIIRDSETIINISNGYATPKEYSNILIDLLDDIFIVEEIMTSDGKSIQRAYKWNNIYWELCAIDTFLINYISTTLYKVIKEHLLKLQNKYNKENENNDKIENASKKMMKALFKIKNDLETPSKMKEIINIFKPAISKNNIEWNKNPYLFVFNNAVYNLEKSEFVEPNKEEYMNMSCGYSYDFNNSYEKEIKIIEDFYSECLDEFNKETTLIYNASCLKRYNTDQIALFNTGTGGNGKGQNIMLLKRTLNNYCKDLPMDYFTTVEKNSNEPNTPLSECRNARLICLSEAEQNENEHGNKIKINKSKFKKCTGQDEIQIRPTFEKVLYRFNMGNILLSTNEIPEMGAIEDPAILRRILIITYKYNFVDNPDPNKKNEKKKNAELQNLFKTEEIRQAYIRILLSNYKIYKKEGLKINQLVRDETHDILNKQNDIYNCITYMLKNKILEQDNDEEVSLKTLFDYYKNSNEGYKFISDKVFTRDIKKIFNKFEYRPGHAREPYLCRYKFNEIKKK